MVPKQRKVCVLGFRAVGKSSLAVQFVSGSFLDTYDPTIENTFNKTVNVKGQEYELSVVDTAGQDEYSIFPARHSVDIDGYILVYSVDSRKSMDMIECIYEKLVDMIGHPALPVVLVGNKRDLEGEEREVKEEDGKDMAGRINAAFMETTAKNNKDASDIFMKAVLQIEMANGDFVEEKGKCSIS